MSELFAWVSWFRELAQKIAEGGPDYLVPRANAIPWNADGKKAGLLNYGDKHIDPFSFFYVLASKNMWESSRHRVHTAVSEHFQLTTKVDFHSGFYYPTPEARAKLLFHNQGEEDPELLWRVFRCAVSGLDSIDGQEFNDVLSIKNVGVPKLTETLFLIHPNEFLPCDDFSAFRTLGTHKAVSDWTTYLKELDNVRSQFPGCNTCEIQVVNFRLHSKNAPLTLTNRVWQSNTKVDGSVDNDCWDDFREQGSLHFPKQRPALREPVPGDLVLVHSGLYEGRGIGIVYHNDHQDVWTPDQRLHVLWMNTVPAKLRSFPSALPFSGAGTTLNVFRDAPEYAPTFEVLRKLGWEDDYSPPPEPLPNGGKEQRPGPDVRSLAKETLIDESELRRLCDLLEDKKQVIFQGPPGTGKTFIARKLAACLAGSSDRVRLVQFHPSFAYEDFVQGFRPTLEDGQAGFELRDGPLRHMAERARESNEKHFLIVDEINRGNLAKILGELYFLLEYRDEEMLLQYSDEPFSLPPNLYIIGTMNTADRSIALVDLALRRRFHFVKFHPDKPPIEGLLGEYLRKHELRQFLWIEDVLKKANEKLNDRHAAIGPSYFMDQGLDGAKIEMVWKHSVLPYIEERLFGQEERLKEFDLDRLRQEVEGQVAEAEEEAADDASGTDEANHYTG